MHLHAYTDAGDWMTSYHIVETETSVCEPVEQHRKKYNTTMGELLAIFRLLQHEYVSRRQVERLTVFSDHLTGVATLNKDIRMKKKYFSFYSEIFHVINKLHYRPEFVWIPSEVNLADCLLRGQTINMNSKTKHPRDIKNQNHLKKRLIESRTIYTNYLQQLPESVRLCQVPVR